MATILFDRIVYGPVHSRRLGVSLGINISPNDGKRCSFNCIYCECGLNEERVGRQGAPRRDEVRQALESKLLEMQADGTVPDVITFSGNGEPTMHPQFAGIIDDTLALRDRLCPAARVAVLSNSNTLHKPEVFDALLRIDDNIMKMDSVIDERIRQIDDPVTAGFTAARLIENLKRFDGRLIIQTIFLRGHRDGVVIDNTAPHEVDQWLDALRQIRPRRVMIYTIARETPIRTLEKIPPAEMDAIAVRVREAGFDVSTSY